MPRSLIGPLSSKARRQDLPWSTVVGLVIAALLVNGVSLYGTSNALSRALQHEPTEDREDIVEFDLVEPHSDDDTDLVSQHRANERVPEDTRRLSDVDSDVARETQAPLGPDSVMSKQSEPGPARDDSERAHGRNAGEQGESEGQGQDAGTGQQQGAGDDSLVHAADGASASAGADAGAQRGKPDPLAMLGGSPSVLDQTFGRPGSPDRLRDVDEGVENVLESKRHVYASFFNRVRDQVADQWRPEKAHRAADPNGTRYGEAHWVTVLMIRVDERTGEVLTIVIEQKSGAAHLDEEAVRAMRAAAPFPNIPEGLADAKGHVEFRFGFIFDVVNGSRIFRYSR